MIDPMQQVTFISLVLLSGGQALVLLALIGHPGRTLGEGVVEDHWLPWICHAGLLLSVSAGLTAALAGNSMPAFALAVLGMSFVFERTHLLRLLRSLRCPALRGDQGAERLRQVFRASLVILTIAQQATSWWILHVLV